MESWRVEMLRVPGGRVAGCHVEVARNLQSGSFFFSSSVRSPAQRLAGKMFNQRQEALGLPAVARRSGLWPAKAGWPGRGPRAGFRAGRREGRPTWSRILTRTSSRKMTAIISLSPPHFSHTTYADLASNEEVRALIAAEVKAVNKTLAKVEQVKKAWLKCRPNSNC